MMIQLYDVTGKLVVEPRVREWCRMPYPGHPKGCPNFGKSEECPPKIGMVSDIFNLDAPHWFVVIRFDLGAHAERMKSLHPAWTNKQARCCLYWQNTVRKKLRGFCNTFIAGSESEHMYTLIPEAMGVNVFKTSHLLGVDVKKNIDNHLYKIALIGSRNSDNT